MDNAAHLETMSCREWQRWTVEREGNSWFETVLLYSSRDSVIRHAHCVGFAVWRISNYGLSMAAKRRSEAPIPRHILEAINRVWLNGIVELGCDLLEELYFHELYPKLHRKLSRIKGAALRYEREAEEQGHDFEDDVSDGSYLPMDDQTYSYHLFFLCPDDELFRYETNEEADEADPDVEEVISGEGFIGCVVGVSLLAPFAIVAPNNCHEYQDGSHCCPELEICAFDENGERLTAEEFFRGQVREQGVRLLYKLCDQAAKVLASHGITVLSEQEQRQTLPWLRAGKQVLREGGPLR